MNKANAMKFSLMLVMIGLVMSWAVPASAATYAVDQAPSGNQSVTNLTYYSGGAAPSPGGSATDVFIIGADVASAVQNFVTNDMAGVWTNNVIVSTNMIRAAYLQGNTLALVSGLTNANAAGLLTISNSIVLAGTNSWVAAGAGTKTVFGGAAVTNNFALNLISANAAATNIVMSEITGSGAVYVGGLGVVGLYSNSYTGNTYITNSSTVQLLGSTAFGAGTVYVTNTNAKFDFGSAGSALTITNNIVNQNSAGKTLTVSNGNNNATLSGVISGQGAVAAINHGGTGVLILSGANTYTGGTLASNALVRVSNSNGLGTGNVIISENGALQFSGGVTITNAVTAANNGTTVAALRNIDSTNTLSGSFTITETQANIQADAGRLIISGNIANGGNALYITNNGTASGSGDVVISGLISGAGDLTVAGLTNGVTYLSNTNTYTGATMINAGGIVNVQATGALGTGAVTNSAGSALQLQGGISVTNASLTFNGTGVSTTGVIRNISGTNTVSCAVVNGTTGSYVGSDSGLLLVTGNLTSGGANRNLGVTGAGDTMFAGTITAGTGGIIKNGTGTLYLTNNNTIGGIALDVGSITAGSHANALGTGFVTVSTNTTLNLKSDSAIAFVAGVSNTFASANATITSARVTSGAAVTNTIGNMYIAAANATNTVSLGDSYTTSGTQGLAIDTATVSASGTALLADKGSGASSGALILSTLAGGANEFAVGGTADVCVTNLTGNGSITKVGTGTLHFQGDDAASPYAGSITNSAGTITLDAAGVVLGSGAGTFVNLSGATLAGLGTNNFANIVNFGTIRPGTDSTCGTLTIVGGNYTGTNATLTCRFNSNASYDKVLIGTANGTAYLGGTTFNPIFNYAPTAGTVYTNVFLLSGAGGAENITAGFSAIANPTPTLKLVPTYVSAVVGQTNEVFFTVARDLNNSAMGLNSTQQGVANSLSSAPASADMTTVLDAIGALTTADQVKAAYDQLTPASVAQLGANSIQAATVQFGNLSGRMQNLRLASSGFSGFAEAGQAAWNYDGQLVADVGTSRGTVKGGKRLVTKSAPTTRDTPWGFFANGQAIFGSQDDKTDAIGYNYTQAGMTMGVDYRLADEAALGLSVGYGNVATHMKQSAGNANADSVSVGPYGMYKWGNFYANTAMTYSHSFYDMQRNINIAGLAPRTAKGTPGGDQLSGFVGTGYDIKLDDFLTGPLATFQASRLWIDSYNEDGAGALNLAVDKQNVTSLQSGLGWRMQYNWKLKDITLTPNAFATWQHEFDQNKRDITSSIGGGSSFATSTASPKRDFANVGCGIGAQITDTISVNLNYGTQVGDSSYSEHTVSGGVRVLF
ncbi:MAG: autotransporter domain-containing protein [Verrucomicrobiae bacterium]|nr:autotransporter domain-containing protein [Verrucomicrobiae bacterium]